MWMATRDFQKAFGPFLSSAEAIERHLLLTWEDFQQFLAD
jgi:hypothetical protein